ncbi:MAG: ribonuclease III [Chlamydiia bacterium]|jgi:ribonuclease-3
MLPYETIEQILSYPFKNREILLTAMIHRSYLNECGQDLVSYERLEFLGDSLLNFFVAEALYRLHPDYKEGELSSLRARLVSKEACSHYISTFDLLPFLLIAKGEMAMIERSKKGIMADLYEAILGAIYQDGGFDAAKDFFARSALVHFAYLKESSKKDFKALLQEYTLRTVKKLPSYEVLFEEGPEHNKSFLVAVFVEEQEAGRGRGTTKKEAEQRAAMEAVLYHGWQDEQTKTRL